jgi:hypothetical protein
MITLKVWLYENEFDFSDIENGDVKIYDEDNFSLLVDEYELDDYEVIDAFTEEGVWIVVVNFIR